jgi:hypothetical protein
MFPALPLRLLSIELPGPREFFSVRLNQPLRIPELDVPQ